MKSGVIDDLMRRGNGAAARIMGQPHMLHRPAGAESPVRSGTGRMRLPALFIAQRATPSGHGHPTFEGVFDSAYAEEGDYLVGDEATFFVATRQPLEPATCVRTNRVVSFGRTPAQPDGGAGGYGGVVRSTTSRLLTGWPASLIISGGGMDRAGIPAGVAVGGWSVLLPATPVRLQPGDLMTDDFGRAGVVSAAELSAYGWKLLVRQATT